MYLEGVQFSPSWAQSQTPDQQVCLHLAAVNFVNRIPDSDCVLFCVCENQKLFCLCVRGHASVCGRYFRRPKARAPPLRVRNEESTLALQKWIRKHGGHNYQAPWCWNRRRCSANRSVSNHPAHCLPSVIQWVYSILFYTRNGP